MSQPAEQFLPTDDILAGNEGIQNSFLLVAEEPPVVGGRTAGGRQSVGFVMPAVKGDDPRADVRKEYLHFNHELAIVAI